MKSTESITVAPSRAESKDSVKVESIDRVGQKLPWIDRLARLDRFWGLATSYKNANKKCIHLTLNHTHIIKKLRFVQIIN